MNKLPQHSTQSVWAREYCAVPSPHGINIYNETHVVWLVIKDSSRLSADLQFTCWWYQYLLHNQILNALGLFPTCRCVSRRD